MAAMPGGGRGAVLPMVVVVVLACAMLSEADPYGIAPKVRDQISKRIRTSSVSKDPLLEMDEKERIPWRGDGLKNISEFIRDFLEVQPNLLVEVKLVGFDGGDAGITVGTDDMYRALGALQKDIESVVLQPEFKKLVIKPRINFMVTRATRGLFADVSAGLQNAVTAEMARPDRQPTEEILLNYQYVDHVIAADASRGRGTGRQVASDGVPPLTVYLLNPKPALGPDEEYLYTYENYGDPKASYSLGCPGTMYVSVAQPAYAWIDIRAGPTMYGPGPGHRGQVLAHSLPHPRHYKPEMLDRAIVPELAALVWSACQHMAWPPMVHNLISPKPNVLIQVVHMHDTLAPPPDRLDQDAIKELLQGAVGPMQKIEVKEIWLPFAHCDICVAAYTTGLKVRTAREDGGVYIQAKTTKILDRLALHQALKDQADSIMTGFHGVAGDPELASHFEPVMSATTHVIPVFVFDISDSSADAILLDGTVKATSFADMVIAVSSRAKKVSSHFTCRWTRCEPQTGNITREVLAALMTTGWGITDTASYYSAGAGEQEDYRWSVGNTAFGPLSHRLTINAVQSLVMQRNIVMGQIEASVARIVRLLEAFRKLSQSGKFDQEVCQDKRNTILTRVNFAHFKLSEAAKMLGLWQAPAADTLVKSMQHDIVALERAARQISSKLEGTVKCIGATPAWSIWWAPAGAVAMWVIAFWVRGIIARSQQAKFDKIY